MITGASRKPFAAVRAPVAWLKEKVAPGAVRRAAGGPGERSTEAAEVAVAPRPADAQHLRVRTGKGQHRPQLPGSDRPARRLPPHPHRRREGDANAGGPSFELGGRDRRRVATNG